MVVFLGWTLEGRLKELGASVPVLRQVDSFLDRPFSLDSEVNRSFESLTEDRIFVTETAFS